MNEAKQRYIEDAGLLFEKFGLTRMAGRAFGYLIVCDKDHVSFNDIMEALQASKGSVSGSMKQLTQIEMAEAITLPGDRKTYYRISKMQIGDILRKRVQQFRLLGELFNRGKETKERTDDVSKWLTEASTFYDWAGEEVDAIIKEWEHRKEDIMEQYYEKNRGEGFS